jgi:hypothetical protein
VVALMVFVILGPLLAFHSQLEAVRREGMDELGSLGQRYASEFDRKWISGESDPSEPLLGSSDLQSLADFRAGFLVVADMQTVPFGLKNVLNLACVTLLPVAPLLLTLFSVEQLVERLLKVVF